MWVVVNAAIGAATMTLAASVLKLKLLMIANIIEYPSNATADEYSSFSVKTMSLQSRILGVKILPKQQGKMEHGL